MIKSKSPLYHTKLMSDVTHRESTDLSLDTLHENTFMNCNCICFTYKYPHSVTKQIHNILPATACDLHTWKFGAKYSSEIFNYSLVCHGIVLPVKEIINRQNFRLGNFSVILGASKFYVIFLYLTTSLQTNKFRENQTLTKPTDVDVSRIHIEDAQWDLSSSWTAE